MRLFDAINCFFEIVGGLMLWLNVVEIMKSGRKLDFINLMIILFFVAWGLWDMVYYWSLNQWVSFWGILIMVLGDFALLAFLKARKVKPIVEKN
jgi:hypothetical protein